MLLILVDGIGLGKDFVVVATDAAAKLLTAAPSCGAKKASVASLVKHLPPHFSASVNGASNNIFKRLSS